MACHRSLDSNWRCPVVAMVRLVARFTRAVKRIRSGSLRIRAGLPKPSFSIGVCEPKSTETEYANIKLRISVARIMKLALPENAKIAKEAKECMQECVSEFISFITSEGQWPINYSRSWCSFADGVD